MKALDLPTHSEDMFTNAEMKKPAVGEASEVPAPATRRKRSRN
jgi:hypothetical protein